jgi:hypothetical protein
MAKPRATIRPSVTSIRQPLVALFGRHPCGVSVSASAVTYFGRPSASASPFRWQRSSAASAVMKGGCQRGTKLYPSFSVHRQENSVLTIHSSSPAHAMSWMWMSPVMCDERARKQASCRPRGSSRRAMSGAERRNQTCVCVPTAIRSGLTATPITRSKL